MWRCALLAVAAVSYLICVLIISGMQKEDLDVSMLQKLQRYNVNFDDINNEQLRRQCFSKNNEFTTIEPKNKTKKDYVLTTEYKSTTKNPLPSVPLDVDSIINYLKAREALVSNIDKTTTGKSTRIFQKMVTPTAEQNEKEPKIEMDLLRRYTQLETQKKYIYKEDDNSQTTKHHMTIDMKTNAKNVNFEFIDKLFKDYLFQKQKISTTTEYITTRYTLDIQSIYKQIDEIIANRSIVDNEKNKTEPFSFAQPNESNTKRNVISAAPLPPINQKISNLSENQLFQAFYNFLSDMNQFKYNLSRPLPFYNNNVYSRDKVEMDKLIGPLNSHDHDRFKETTTFKYKSEIASKPGGLTPNLVKEITKTVKDNIIKDLRNELADMYIKTTQKTAQIIATTITTTTDKPPTTTSKNKTEEKDLSIMDKFMDLYEQIKSLKQTKFMLKPNNESDIFINDLTQPIKSPVKSAKFMSLSDKLPISETKVSISTFGNYNSKQIFNHNPYLPRRENRQPHPITIQTNSVEIQPLAVRISKPESLIRQNIIVHPGHSFQRREDHPRQISLRGNKYSKIPIKHKNSTHIYSPMKRYDGYNVERYPLYIVSQEPKREDIIRFTMRDNGNSRFDTDYYEKINFGNDHKVAKDKHEFRNHNIPRYHERLERVDTGSDGIPVVFNVDSADKQGENAGFPPRQQLPLIDMKKGSSYDETHFKNFLKTQQKVTDMLERILATRPKTNTPQSVETI